MVYFGFILSDFGVIPKNTIEQTSSWSFAYVFSSVSFMDLYLACMYLILVDFHVKSKDSVLFHTYIRKEGITVLFCILYL